MSQTAVHLSTCLKCAYVTFVILCLSPPISAAELVNVIMSCWIEKYKALKCLTVKSFYLLYKQLICYCVDMLPSLILKYSGYTPVKMHFRQVMTFHFQEKIVGVGGG